MSEVGKDCLELLDRFLDTIWAERGLSENSLEAYCRDLVKLLEWLTLSGKTAVTAKREDLLKLLAREVSAGRSPRSLSRYLSAYRRYNRGPICANP